MSNDGDGSDMGKQSAADLGRRYHVHLIRFYIRVQPLKPAFVGVVLETEQQHLRLHPLHNLPHNMDIRACSIDSVPRGCVLFSVRGSI